MKKQKDERIIENTEEPAPETKTENKGRRIANTVVNVLLVVAIVIAAVCTYVSFISTSGNGVPSIFGVEMLSIQTDSMYPTFSAGDLIFAKRVKDTSALQIDDIITYWTVIEGERVLNTHRIVGVYDGGDHLVFKTKGDNNTDVDDLDVHEAEVVGRYTDKKIKGAGKVFDFLQTSTGFLIVVVVPVGIFFIYHLVQFFRVMFEYQSVKSRLLYEQEREAAEAENKQEEEKQKERERLEAEIRAQILAEMKNKEGNNDTGDGASD